MTQGRQTPSMTQQPRFALAPDQYTSWAHAGAVIYAAPFGRTVTYQTGTERGPAAIIKASANLEWYDLELDAEPYRHGIHTLPFPDAGAMASSAKMLSWVQATALKILDAVKFPILLGGEHSVSIGADGVLFPCCHFAADPSRTFGDLHTASLREIWHGEQAQAFRAEMRHLLLTRADPTLLPHHRQFIHPRCLGRASCAFTYYLAAPRVYRDLDAWAESGPRARFQRLQRLRVSARRLVRRARELLRRA